MQYAPSLEALQENALVCKHCGKAGRMTYQKSEKAQMCGGVPLSADPAHYHCNFCGANTYPPEA